MIGATPALPEWDQVSYAAGEETGGNCTLERFSSGCSPWSGFLRRQAAAGGICGSGSPAWPVLVISMGNVHPGGGRGVTRMGDDATSISVGMSHLLRELARLGKGLVGSIRCVPK